MATLEDLGRMAMVEVDNETQFPDTSEAADGWGRMALMLAASAVFSGMDWGLKSLSTEYPTMQVTAIRAGARRSARRPRP